MTVAVVGYGRMGKQIEKVLLEKKLKVISIDKFNNEADFKSVDTKSLENVDVAIDFSFADSVVSNVKSYVDNNVAVVMGTTGWYEKIDEIKKIISNKCGFIWSGNFSVGVNIYFRIVKAAAEMLNNFPQYDPLVLELHHKQKKDSPSGTAHMLGDILLNTIKRKDTVTTDKIDREINNNEIHVASGRCGYFPGTHQVIFDSAIDTIELKHTARTREGFAVGAVMAAEWIKDKKGFYSIDDFINSVI